MAQKIKEVARFFGATVVGITHLDQAYVYSHRARGNADMGQKPGDPIDLPHRYAICLSFVSDYSRPRSPTSGSILRRSTLIISGGRGDVKEPGWP